MKKGRSYHGELKLKLHLVGEPVLRQVARELTPDEIRTEFVQRLIEDMRETMRDAPGVGLAAPQVGVGLQIAVLEDQPSYIERLPPGQAAERQREPVPFHVIINPKLTIVGDETAEFYEGCLSLPGFAGIVKRALSVRVEALNAHAEPVVLHAQGWYARILQHEIDHLNGTVYIDRMYPRSFVTADNHARYWKDRTTAELNTELDLYRRP